MAVSRVIAPCTLVEAYRRFRERAFVIRAMSRGPADGGYCYKSKRLHNLSIGSFTSLECNL